jgi:hypothetical protein
VNRNQILWLVAIAGVAIWLWKSGKISKVDSTPAAPAGSTLSSGSMPGAAGEACLSAAGEASRQTQAAADVLLRSPIDPAAFSSAFGGASTAISSAEGKCGGGGSTVEQRAMEEARGALSEMRALLSELSSALSGSGSASDAPRRRESIDRHLDAARTALRG